MKSHSEIASQHHAEIKKSQGPTHCESRAPIGHHQPPIIQPHRWNSKPLPKDRLSSASLVPTGQ